MANTTTKKQEIFDYVYAMLGGGMVDVELDPVHYETALTKALTRYRQRSDHSAEESYLFMPTIVDQNTYTLPYTNTYLLSGSNMGGLATYDMFSQYQELVGRMFGSFIEFNWNSVTKQLTMLQRPRAEETLMLYCYNYRPDESLFSDYMAIDWIKSYTLATCKFMLGEARSKFATIAGPQGGSQLNGDTLKAEAQAEMEKLENEVSMAMAGGTGYGFTIG